MNALNLAALSASDICCLPAVGGSRSGISSLSSSSYSSDGIISPSGP